MFKKALKIMLPQTVLNEALLLNPVHKAELVAQVLYSLDKSDKDIDELWNKESEDRIDAFEKGKLKAISLEEVLKRYQ